ncbi:hypothetical protein T484DRAFT_1819584 [Baffinella frigidus]|nr:hypothetical protein T484DRAFT_1819584 [Cryptophyta sp. CCMP2293]
MKSRIEDCMGVFLAAPKGVSQDSDLLVLFNRQWDKPMSNFDSFQEAMFSGYLLFLNNGWPNLIDSAMAVTAAGKTASMSIGA